MSGGEFTEANRDLLRRSVRLPSIAEKALAELDRQRERIAALERAALAFKARSEAWVASWEGGSDG